MNVQEYDVELILKEIKAECEREMKGYCLLEVADGYSFVTRPEYAPYIEKLVNPGLIILHKQPWKLWRLLLLSNR